MLLKSLRGRNMLQPCSRRSTASRILRLVLLVSVITKYALRIQKSQRHAGIPFPFSFVSETTLSGKSLRTNQSKAFYLLFRFLGFRRLYGMQVYPEKTGNENCAAGKVHGIFTSLQTAAARSFFQTALPGSEDRTFLNLFGTRNRGRARF